MANRGISPAVVWGLWLATGFTGWTYEFGRRNDGLALEVGLFLFGVVSILGAGFGALCASRLDAARRIAVIGAWVPLAVLVIAWRGLAPDAGGGVDLPKAWIGLLFVASGFDLALRAGGRLRDERARRMGSWVVLLGAASLFAGISGLALDVQQRREPPASQRTAWSDTLQLMWDLRENYPHWDAEGVRFRSWFDAVRPELRSAAERCTEEAPCSVLLSAVQAALRRIQNEHVRAEPPVHATAAVEAAPTSTKVAPPNDGLPPWYHGRSDTGVESLFEPGRPLWVRVSHLRSPDFAARIDDALSRPSVRRGVILDLRGCPGGESSNLEALLSRFLPFGSPAGRFVGRERDGKRPTVNRLVLDPIVRRYSGPLVVLVDFATQSGAEVAAFVLCDSGRARCVGSSTTGSTDLAHVYAFHGGKVVLSVATYETREGALLHRRGFSPEVQVQHPFAFEADAPDEALELAIGMLQSRSEQPLTSSTR